MNLLRAFDIPTIVGAGPDDANASNSQYPENPDPSSQEVAVQRLTRRDRITLTAHCNDWLVLVQNSTCTRSPPIRTGPRSRL